MRGCVILSVLALAGCGEHLGWNPNYNFGPTRYGEYRALREGALVTGADAPEVIPLARPFYAPTAADIAGQDPVPAPPTRRVVPGLRPVATIPTYARTGSPAPVAIVPETMRRGNQPPL